MTTIYCTDCPNSSDNTFISVEDELCIQCSADRKAEQEA